MIKLTRCESQHIAETSKVFSRENFPISCCKIANDIGQSHQALKEKLTTLYRFLDKEVVGVDVGLIDWEVFTVLWAIQKIWATFC